jgi:cellobiose transport system permease protein
MISSSKIGDFDFNVRKEKIKSISYGQYGYFFVIPFILFFLVFTLYPTLYTFIMSFTNTKGYDPNKFGDFVWFKTYGEVLKDNSFWVSIGRTLRIWGVNVVLQFGLALFIAALFNDQSLKIKGQPAFKFAYYLPNIVTAATIGLLVRQSMETSGAINVLLSKYIKGYARRELLLDPDISQLTVSLVLTWIWYGNTMIVLLAGMAGINPTLYEAARIDGANSTQQFFYITLPLLRTILLYAFVTSLAGGLQMYDVPFFFNPTSNTQTVAIKIYVWGFTGTNQYGKAAAGSVIMLIFTMLISSVLFFLMNLRTDARPKKA